MLGDHEYIRAIMSDASEVSKEFFLCGDKRALADQGLATFSFQAYLIFGNEGKLREEINDGE